MGAIGIVGTGPTGIYTVAALVANPTPIEITLFEQGDQAGVGMVVNAPTRTRRTLSPQF